MPALRSLHGRKPPPFFLKKFISLGKFCELVNQILQFCWDRRRLGRLVLRDDRLLFRDVRLHSRGAAADAPQQLQEKPPLDGGVRLRCSSRRRRTARRTKDILRALFQRSEDSASRCSCTEAQRTSARAAVESLMSSPGHPIDVEKQSAGCSSGKASRIEFATFCCRRRPLAFALCGFIEFSIFFSSHSPQKKKTDESSFQKIEKKNIFFSNISCSGMSKISPRRLFKNEHSFFFSSAPMIISNSSST